ncbi:olfactory receptor 5AP2-like [Alligator mississippiensis]|uniref:olfactory receptor 5AP2-like n=1 Tax=Alligator mississippiensis TaxID=8496 RepID=UPI0009071438|nr:olfactory receptor 5AP2-like [Alligator mississippiensis]
MKEMAMTNHTQVTEFILSGLTDQAELQVPLFMLLQAMYIITVIGNLSIFFLITVDSHLHTPMYFFLASLSFLDICYSPVIFPKMLQNILSENKAISYNGCAAQMFFFGALATTECFLLAVMAYDRYVAICSPLLYTTIMSCRVCVQLVSASYLGGFIHSAIHTGFTFTLLFCGPNEINHFFCDIPPLIKLSCSDTHVNEMVMFVATLLISGGSSLTILVSCGYILATILRIHSAEGRRKAFSTCTSHLTSVSIFYGSILCMYLQPASGYSLEQDHLASVFYTLVIPMLNPLIYSLRNKDVKDAIKRVIRNRIY